MRVNDDSKTFICAQAKEKAKKRRILQPKKITKVVRARYDSTVLDNGSVYAQTFMRTHIRTHLKHTRARAHTHTLGGQVVDGMTEEEFAKQKEAQEAERKEFEEVWAVF